VIALENSRSFADSPIGGGPIVRVGDRLSVFSPSLTAAVVKCAEGLAGASPAVSGTVGKSVGAGNWKWQRKLMSGGACEASVYCQAGYEATCVCLALGNYHNMGNLDAVQAGGGAAAARVAREFVSLADYDGLVDLLVACGESLPEAPGIGGLVERLWSERAWVLDDAVRR
jgi:endoglucanase